jgi:hypothetical protein
MTSSDNVSFRTRPQPGEELAGPPAWAGFTLEIRPPGPCFRLACVPPGGAAGFEGQKPAGGLWCHGLLDPLALPDDQSRLLVENTIETGPRWGERAADARNRVRHPDADRQPGRGQRPSAHPPEGGRFLVKGYPKDGEYRRLKVSLQITAQLKAQVTERGLGRDDLIFQTAK